MKKALLKILSSVGLGFFISLYDNFVSKERRKSYGKDNPDKIFYVIGQKERSGGLWWIVNKVLMHIAYAEDKGYIPVVDYKSFWTQYHMPDELGNTNIWEKFFLQPAGYDLQQISRSKNIIISDKYAAPSEQYLMGNTDFYDNPMRLDYFRQLFKKYIKFSLSTYNYLENQRKTIIPNGARVVGVLCRGTDYLLKKPKNHPVQPNPTDVIKDVRKVMLEYNCNYVFLATEDSDILDLFKNEFGSSLLYVNQHRFSKVDMQDATLVVDVAKKSSQDKYYMGLNYLLATYILSRCNCFIGGRTGGTKGVLLMHKGFEYCYIYSLGFYE